MKYVRYVFSPVFVDPLKCISTQAFGTIAIQLAHHRGAKVISTACSLEDKQHLEKIRPAIGACSVTLLSIDHLKHKVLQGIQNQ